MRKLNPRERLLAIICGLLLLLALLGQGLAKPLQLHLAQVSRQLRTHDEDIRRALLAKNDMYQFERDITTLSDQRKRLIISGEVVPEMLRLVGQAAKKAKITQLDLHPLGAEVQDSYLRNRLQLEFETTFPQLRDLLYYLEAPEIPLVLDRIEINASKEGSSDMVHSTLLVSGYSLPKGDENEK